MKKRILITGGAGFIGSNAAKHFLDTGWNVSILDNFSRNGARDNLLWLQTHSSRLHVWEGDIRDERIVAEAVGCVDVILHLAAQVAVTTSVSDPKTDFEINALGTFTLLDAVRKGKGKQIVLFSSTNKVYGGMETVRIVERDGFYCYRDFPWGISETFPLDFHSPYGCSKGSADQYVRDYGRVYGFPTVVFRQSCIFGPRQWGVEDQGWVAWFIIATFLRKKITVYGDGKQVRDVLYIDDLIRLYDLSIQNISRVQGEVYNVGGGKNNTLSVWHQFGDILRKLFQRDIPVSFSDWRPGDQKVFVSDIRKVTQEFEWEPTVGAEEGIIRLYHWVERNVSLFRS